MIFYIKPSNYKQLTLPINQTLPLITVTELIAGSTASGATRENTLDIFHFQDLFVLIPFRIGDFVSHLGCGQRTIKRGE